MCLKFLVERTYSNCFSGLFLSSLGIFWNYLNDYKIKVSIFTNHSYYKWMNIHYKNLIGSYLLQSSSFSSFFHLNTFQGLFWVRDTKSWIHPPFKQLLLPPHFCHYKCIHKYSSTADLSMKGIFSQFSCP